MNRKLLGRSLVALGVIVAAAFLIVTVPGFVSLVFDQRPREEDTAAYRHKPLLRTFDTFTVEVSYEQGMPDKVLGYDKSALGDLILKEISARVEKRFGNTIASSRYGKPYSFQTNPLNLAITFTISQTIYDPAKFETGVSFARSSFFSHLSGYSLLDGPTITEGLSFKRLNGGGTFKTGDELISQINALSDVVVKDMNPDVDTAVRAEENWKRGRSK